jgi:hypothetical protein
VVARRVEIIRFGLLVTMTIALVSVATRGSGHHQGTHHAAGSPAVVGASPSATTPASPSATAPASTGGNGQAAAGSGSSGPATTRSGGSAAGGTGGLTSSGTAAGEATLPRTGSTHATVLVDLALLLVGGGAWTVVASRPAPRRTTRL